MKVTLESTTKIVNASGVDYRVWEGVTERGVRVSALIPRIAVAAGDDVTQFEAELQEHASPTATVEAWPLRMIL